MTTITPEQLLEEAADAIEEYGWTKRMFGNKNCGFCAIGAIRYANSKRGLMQDCNAEYQAEDKLFNYLRLDGETMSIPMWNDSFDRTKDEVVEALREAAKS